MLEIALPEQANKTKTLFIEYPLDGAQLHRNARVLSQRWTSCLEQFSTGRKK